MLYFYFAGVFHKLVSNVLKQNEKKNLIPMQCKLKALESEQPCMQDPLNTSQ